MSKTIEKILWRMEGENIDAAILKKKHTEAIHTREKLYFYVQEMEALYGKKLRALVQRKAARIVRKYTRSFPLSVEVAPLYAHGKDKVTPLIIIRWSDRHAEVKLRALATEPAIVEQFLEMFESMVKATATTLPTA